MSFLRRVVKKILPRGSIAWLIEMRDWLKVAPVLSMKQYSVPYIEPQKTYKNLVITKGFGHGGSGAVLDYLSEFDDFTVLGGHDINDGSGFPQQKSTSCEEFDFFRRIGGVIELENVFVDESCLSQDFAVKLFLHVSEYFYRQGGIYSDKFWELTNQFVERIVDYKIPTTFGFEGLYMLGLKCGWKKYKNISSMLCTDCHYEKKYIYGLKKLKKSEYRSIAKEYIHSVLTTMPSNDFLVLDGAVDTRIIGTPNIDIGIKLEYMGDFKMIASYRDPRDVYVTGIKMNAQWMPRNPETFVKWFLGEAVGLYLAESHPNRLLIRFEDFVLNYDETSEKINEFIGIDENLHIHKREYFNPDVSKKNIGLWKNFENQEAIKYIETNLKEFCYYEKEAAI